MSWKDYNSIISELIERFDLTRDEAREHYSKLGDAIGHSPTVSDLDRIDDLDHLERVEAGAESDDFAPYDDLDEWIEDYEDHEFDDYDVDELNGGVDTGKGKKR